jgi:hypothetical protein
MREYSTSILGSYFQKRALKRWERLCERAQTTDITSLKSLRTSARATAQRVGDVNHIVEARLTRPFIGSEAMKLPPATDWSHRPDLWSGPLSPSGIAPARNNATLGDAVTLYHDCKKQTLSLRQIRNTRPSDVAPFGLQMEIYTFDGSFLSLVLKAPEGMVKGLTKNHILRLSVRIESERPLEIATRMNLQHGPNTEQVSMGLDQSQSDSLAEFDLAYVPFNEKHSEHIWFDLFFDSPSMNKVTLRDLTLSRHTRSKL